MTCSKSEKPVFLRVLLKLSGEALIGKQQYGVDPEAIHQITSSISELVRLGVEIGIVIGGGNFFRGAELARTGLNRVTADQMGMLATVMNGLLLRDSFATHKIPTRVMSAVEIPGFVEAFDRHQAKYYLGDGKVVIFVAGTGSPLFSTDSAASLRGIEIDADILLKATKVDGVYSSDPKVDPLAERFDRLTYSEVIEKQLKVMDLPAICLCKDHDLPVRVFDMNQLGILKNIIMGSSDGTLISN